MVFAIFEDFMSVHGRWNHRMWVGRLTPMY